MQKSIEKLKELTKDVVLLEHAIATLSWDQETYMPSKAIGEKGEQLALLQGIMHEKVTSSEIGKFLEILGAGDNTPSGIVDSATTTDKAFIKELYRQYKIQTRLSKKLVTDLALETSLSQAAWIEARKKSDYSIFKPHLNKVLELTKQKAESIGYNETPYDALLDEFEPWTTAKEVDDIFKSTQPWLTEFIGKINNSKQVDDSFLLKDFDISKQEVFGRKVLQDMGYSYDRGRLDVSAHPFTTTLGQDDVRLTTRYQKDFFKTGLFGIIHECGHGLYELGFGDNIKGNLLASSTSLGIHESQSRTWENIIGRSMSFWKYYYPELQKYFPENLENISLDNFYKGINKVEPSLIRVEADEVTYNLHIILRFQLEQELISGTLSVGDLPEAWNSKTKDFFGITPDSDANGVLQDIHWPMGAFGYFPTYALGNMYSAQFTSKMNKEIDVDKSLENGNLINILDWLRENIHKYGASKTASELALDITGEKLNPEYFKKYLENKYKQIYDL
ncbi:MAG: carboxypeptidase M32 [Spirochaetes bacterium]|nr:MAG: carboxypeptidase M32 [Spirochaetota bacterium]